MYSIPTKIENFIITFVFPLMFSGVFYTVAIVSLSGQVTAEQNMELLLNSFLPTIVVFCGTIICNQIYRRKAGILPMIQRLSFLALVLLFALSITFYTMFVFTRSWSFFFLVLVVVVFIVATGIILIFEIKTNAIKGIEPKNKNDVFGE